MEKKIVSSDYILTHCRDFMINAYVNANVYDCNLPLGMVEVSFLIRNLLKKKGYYNLI